MELKNLIGKKVNRVFINSNYLKFETDKGNLVYKVSGDCCSHSYFHDFFGVKNLLENGVVKDVKEVELLSGDVLVENNSEEGYGGEKLKVYGYQITTEGKYGDMTSVFSFRNASNGYYGGGIDQIDNGDKEVLPEIKKDVGEIKIEDECENSLNSLDD